MLLSVRYVVSTERLGWPGRESGLLERSGRRQRVRVRPLRPGDRWWPLWRVERILEHVLQRERTFV